MERPSSADWGTASRLAVGEFVIDLQRRELLDAAGGQVDLRRQSLAVLLELAANVGHVVGKDELLARVWAGVVVTEDSLVQAIADIRRVLGDRKHELVRTVQRRGYVLAPPATDITSASAAAATVPVPEVFSVLPVSGPPAVGGRASAAQRWFWPLVAVGLLGVAALWSAQKDGFATRSGDGAPQIAVLAFHDRGRGVEAASLAAGLSEDLVMELGRNQGLNVVAHHSSFAVSGQGLSAPELGRRLRAQYLVDGSVQRDGARLTLEVELVDVRADKVLWVTRQQTDGGQVVRARDDIARKVAGTLLSKMRESEKQRAVRAAPKSLDVYAWTQRGLALKHQFTPEATRESRAGLERALAVDPQYAAAWWVLGWLNAVDAWMGLSGEWNLARMPEAIKQINHSIELDPYSSAAHQALAVALGQPGSVKESMAAAQRAVDLAPGDAQAWLFLGMTTLPVGAPEEALRAIERAMEMNPIPPTYFTAIYARALWANGRDDDALREAVACTRQAPLYNDCRFIQFIVHAKRGEFERGREHLAVLMRSDQRASGYCTGNTSTAERHAHCVRLAAAGGLSD